MIKILTLLTISLSFLSGCGHAPEKISSTSSIPASKMSKGMVSIGPNIYVDTEMQLVQRKQLLKDVEHSIVGIKHFFGDMKSSPNIYACSTHRCFKTFGGVAADAKTINDDTVILSKVGLNRITITHELTHAEFNHRLGKSHWHKTPMWFDEGLAALVCKDPKYAKYVPHMPLHKLSNIHQWLDATRKQKPVYNVARQAIESWYNKVGPKGLTELIERIKQGEDLPFETIMNSTHQLSKI